MVARRLVWPWPLFSVLYLRHHLRAVSRHCGCSTSLDDYNAVGAGPARHTPKCICAAEDNQSRIRCPHPVAMCDIWIWGLHRPAYVETAGCCWMQRKVGWCKGERKDLQSYIYIRPRPDAWWYRCCKKSHSTALEIRVRIGWQQVFRWYFCCLLLFVCFAHFPPFWFPFSAYCFCVWR